MRPDASLEHIISSQIRVTHFGDHFGELRIAMLVDLIARERFIFKVKKTLKALIAAKVAFNSAVALVVHLRTALGTKVKSTFLVKRGELVYFGRLERPHSALEYAWLVLFDALRLLEAYALRGLGHVQHLASILYEISTHYVERLIDVVHFREL